jgi:hypothetical protein
MTANAPEGRPQRNTMTAVTAPKSITRLDTPAWAAPAPVVALLLA